MALGNAVRMNWTSEWSWAHVAQRVRTRLQDELPRHLLLFDVPDARSEREVHLCSLLVDAGGPRNAGELTQALARMELRGNEPQQLCEITSGLPYQVELRCAASSRAGRFDVLFSRTVDRDAHAATFAAEPGHPRPWRHYANNPLQGIVGQRLVPSLRLHLKRTLPEYMVPASVVLLEQLPLGPNGKVDRQALPAPDGLRPELAVKYAAPRTPAESALAQIWAEMLGLDQVGIHDNFFELGGDSILSIQIIARANRAGLRVTPAQLFQYQTVAELAECAGAMSAVLAEQEAVSGEVALTPIQCWFFERPRQVPEHFNQAVLLPLRRRSAQAATSHGRARASARCTAPALRSRGEPVASVPRPDRGVSRVDCIDLTSVEACAQASALSAAAAQAQASLNLQHGPLVRAQLFELGEEQHLLLVIHHLVVDGVSWRILLEDFASAYRQLCRGEAVQLPAKTTSFRQWAQRLQEYNALKGCRSGRPRCHRPVMSWHSTSTLPLNTTRWRAGASSRACSMRTRPKVCCSKYRPRIARKSTMRYSARCCGPGNASVLKARCGWIWKVMVANLFDDVDLTRTVGWFTTIFPVRLECSLHADCAQTLQAVKEQLRHVPRRGIGYGVLRYLSADAAVRTELAAQPSPTLSFNYLGQLGAAASGSYDLGPAHAPADQRRHLIEINARIEGGCCARSGLTANPSISAPRSNPWRITSPRNCTHSLPTAARLKPVDTHLRTFRRPPLLRTSSTACSRSSGWRSNVHEPSEY